MFEIGLVDIYKNIVQSSSLIIMLLEKFPYVRCKLTTYFRRVFFCNIHNVVSYVNFLVFTQFYQFKSVLFLLKLFSNFHIFFIVFFTLFLEWTISPHRFYFLEKLIGVTSLFTGCNLIPSSRKSLTLNWSIIFFYNYLVTHFGDFSKVSVILW